MPEEKLVFRPMQPGDRTQVATMIKALYRALKAP